MPSDNFLCFGGKVLLQQRLGVGVGGRKKLFRRGNHAESSLATESLCLERLPNVHKDCRGLIDD